MFLEHRELMSVKGAAPDQHYEIPFGQARVAGTGSDATVVAVALMVYHAEKAAEKLDGEGLSIEIIDPRIISPLDIDTILQSVAKSGRLGPCSLASQIAAHVADRGFEHLDAPISGSTAHSLRRHTLRLWRQRSSPESTTL